MTLTTAFRIKRVNDMTEYDRQQLIKNLMNSTSNEGNGYIAVKNIEGEIGDVYDVRTSNMIAYHLQTKIATHDGSRLEYEIIVNSKGTYLGDLLKPCGVTRAKVVHYLSYGYFCIEIDRTGEDTLCIRDGRWWSKKDDKKEESKRMTVLTNMARELLMIDEDIPYRLSYHEDGRRVSLEHYEMHTFTQMWGSTAGGFNDGYGLSGCAMTRQRTYVFTPKSTVVKDCLVYFGGRFAYKVPYSKTFADDVLKKCVAGMAEYKIKYGEYKE